MVNSNTFDFSFSGLKTSVLYFHRDHPDAKLEDVCAGVQEAIINSLHLKTVRALEQYDAQALLVGGGSSC